LGGPQFHINEEAEMAVVNGCECKSPNSAVVEYFNMRQDEENASVCSGIMLENNDTSVE
jgi:hypothetical protein